MNYKVISTEQQAYQPKCHTTNNGRIAKNMMEDARWNHHVLWILSLDSANAYGTLVHHKAVETLQQLGMPPDLVAFVKHLYENFGATIITGKGDSARFPVGAGVIQGDPLSCQLFVLSGSEPMVRAAKESGEGYISRTLSTAGIISILGFCDDHDLPGRSLDGLKVTYVAFRKPYDYRQFMLKPPKCKLVLVAPHSKRKELVDACDFEIDGTPVIVVPENENIRCLGFPVGGDGKAGTMRKELSTITSINLGRLKWLRLRHGHLVLVVVSKILSPLLYRSAVAPFTKTWLNKLQTQVNAVFYNNLNIYPDIPLEALHMSTSMGGLGVPSLVNRDEITFATHYMAALNSRNDLVRLTTRDRLTNELPRLNLSNLSNHFTSDPHKLLYLIHRAGGTLRHKQPANEDCNPIMVIPRALVAFELSPEATATSISASCMISTRSSTRPAKPYHSRKLSKSCPNCAKRTTPSYALPSATATRNANRTGISVMP